MKRVLIDTNALISFVTTRNLQQQELVSPLFEEAARAHRELLCPQNVVAEFAYVMSRVYSVPKAEVAIMIRDLIALPGVQIVEAVDWDIFLSLWPDKIQEYGDAVIATVAKAHRGVAVVTFDVKLAGTLKALRLPLYVQE